MTAQDAEQLRLLSIFQFVYAGLMGLVALIPIIHVSLGVAIVSGALPMGPSGGSAGGPPPAVMGWFFIVIGGAIILFGFLTAALNALGALFLRRHTHRTFCMVVAAVDCLNMPLGTALGVFTLIVLGRPGVRAEFRRSAGNLPYAA
jgi:hypothetical protein